METAANRKQQLEAFQKRMSQSTSSLGGNVNAVKTPTKFRSSFSSVKTSLKAVLSSPKHHDGGRNSPTAFASDASIEVEEEADARSDTPSSTRRQSVRNIGKKLDDVEAMNKAARRMSAPANIAKKETSATVSKMKKTTAAASSEEGSKTKKQRRATINAASASTDQAVKVAAATAKSTLTRMSRRASCPVVNATTPVELTDFVQLDKAKRRETLAVLGPQEVEHLFVESSRKLLAKKTSLQKQLGDLQAQHAEETRRLQEQLVDANMRLKQRELVHAQRQVNQESSLQKEHQRLHQAMISAQTNFQQQASELETRSLTLMEQVAEMQHKIAHVDDYEEAANEATYFSFQLMMLLAVGVAAVWAPASVCEAGSAAAQSLSNLPSMWIYGA